jgi:hypothetical protein
VHASAGLRRWSLTMALPVAMVPIGSQWRGMRWLFRYVPVVPSGKPPWIPVWSTVTSCPRSARPSALWVLARSGEITWNLWVTTYRALGELVIGSLLGIVAHQRRTAGTVRSVPLRVAWSASNACFPFATHSARACSP